MVARSPAFVVGALVHAVRSGADIREGRLVASDGGTARKAGAVAEACTIALRPALGCALWVASA